MKLKKIKKIIKKRLKKNWDALVVGAVLIIALIFIFIFWNGDSAPFDFISIGHNQKSNHVKKPDVVKGIYLTAYSANSKRFDQLLELIKNTELNAMIIDIKTGSGSIAFEPINQNLKKYSSVDILIDDFDEMIKKAHDAGVYLIARNFVFQDPAVVKKNPNWAVQNKYGGVWKDWKGVTWLDPAVQGVWEYNAELAKEVYARGFDEINFDYIRFPSDGNLSSMKFNYWDGKDRYETMEKFYTYLDENLRKKGIIISADLFGLTCCNTGIPSIGQNVIDALKHFDAVGQMVYPSHYYNGFIGLSNPALYPYDVVKYSLDKTNEQIEEFKKENPDVELGTLRPWLQDFDLGAVYDAQKVRAQIQATYDAGGSGWMIWNARNVYTENAFLESEEVANK